MKVRIPMARGENGAPVADDGAYAFVIVDTAKIVCITRRAEAFRDGLSTKTAINMDGGFQLEITDEDLCTEWTHDRVLQVLAGETPTGSKDTRPRLEAGWNPIESEPATRRT